MGKRKVPKRLRDEFFGWMDAHNDDEMPDGAWFATLEWAGEEFAKEKNLHWCDGNDLAHEYIAMKEKEQAPLRTKKYPFSPSHQESERHD